MIQLAIPPLPGTVEDPRYPDGDGKPMAETYVHVTAIILLLQALQDLLADREDVFIGANLFFYYEEGNRKARVAPDGLVSFKVGNHQRRSYRLWEEKKPPDVLFEVSSNKTYRKDLGEKKDLYARLGVREYFLFDPDGKYLRPAVQGFRLVKGQYMPIKPGPDGSLLSKQLHVRLRAEGEMLRLVDLRTGTPLPTRQEQVEQARQKALAERRHAQAEQQRADEALRLAKNEKQRADLLAERLTALEEEFARWRRGHN